MGQLSATEIRLALVALLAAAAAVAAFPLLGSGGWVFRQSSLDLHFLSPWIAAAGVLFVLGRLAAIFQEMLLRRLVGLAVGAGEPGNEEARWAISRRLRWAEVAQALAEGSALTVAAAGVIAAVPRLPEAFLQASGGESPGRLDLYLAVFGSLLPWAAAALSLFVAGRAASRAWPEYRSAWSFPWRRLLLLAFLYVLLADGGWLFLASGISLGPLLWVLVLAVALSYLTGVVRQLESVSSAAWLARAARWLVPVFCCAEVALILAVMLTLPGLSEGLPQERYGGTLESIGPYLPILDSLANWALVLLVPFIVARAVAAFRPAVGEALGFPIGRIILFFLALAVFSDIGLLAVAFGLELSHLSQIIGAALLLSWLVAVLRRVAGLGLPERVVGPLNNALPLVSALVAAGVSALVVGEVLGALPSITAPLLDSRVTSEFGDVYFPVLANLYEARTMLTAFIFALVLTLSLPNPLWSPARWRLRPMLACLGFAAAGCLGWIASVQLSGLGHGYTLVGAIMGTGLLALGLSQLAAYLMDFEDTAVSGAAGWLRNSPQRAFWIGAAIAAYGMLLRPLIYETLWFAEVYEWLVILALALLAMLKIRSGLKTFVVASEAVAPTWNRWNRHRQEFQDRPDPRQELVSRWRQRFVEQGEWAGLWTYYMGLLYRNNWSPESVQTVVRPLRDSVAAPGSKVSWLGGGQAGQNRREAALAESLRRAEDILSGPPPFPAGGTEPSLRQTAEHYVETGEGPETVAALLVDSYCRQGTGLEQAVSLWFPLVDVVEGKHRWFDLPWVREGKARAAKDRRRKLVEAAMEHLSGQLGVAELPVAVAASALSVYPSAMPAASLGPSAVIAPGQGFEVLRDQGSTVQVRTGGNVEGYVRKSGLAIQPILPGDEVNGIYE